MARMWRAAILTLVWTMAAAAPGAAQETGSKPPRDDARPDIAMRVSPPFDFSPARISVRAALEGGALDYEPFYCTTIVWEWGDGTTSENSADCPPYVAGTSKIRRYFSSTHTYSMAGLLTIRFRMKKGGLVVGGTSAPVLIRPAIRTPGEIPE